MISQATVQAAAVLAAARRGDDLLEGLFDHQKQFIGDKSRFINAVCSRRAGKTYSLARKVLSDALKHPDARVAYVCDTGSHAEELVWIPMLDLLTDMRIPHKTNTTKLRIALPNRSIIKLAGCDNERAMGKLLGQAYRTVIIDEAQNFPPYLERLINEILGPAMADYGGQIIVSGTPEPTATSYFHKISAGTEQQRWSQHHWTVGQNPMFPQWRGKYNWRELVSDWLKSERELFHYTEDDPRYQRDYLGLWSRSDSIMILIVPDKAIISPSAIPVASEMTNVLGIDLGFKDEAAWVVAGTPHYERKLYEVASFAESRLTLSAIVKKTQEMIERYDPQAVVVDPARSGNALVEEINTRFGVPAKIAEKKEKGNAYAMLKGYILDGEIFFRDDSRLSTQAKNLVWNQQQTREAEGIQCDLMDAFLYAFREALHWIADKKPEAFAIGSCVQVDFEARRREEAEMEQALRGLRDDDVDFY